MQENKLPKILSNIPIGKDLLKAESHKKIANSIISIIENQSNVIDKQIIGLEGDWGTGKSNIIKIIEDEISKKKKLKDKYLHYTFDTWTHQEDLTRKSIIIELINSLRNNIDSFNSENWINKEAELSQKRISKNTKHFPQIKLYYVFLVIGFVIIKFVNETKKLNIKNKLYGYYEDSLSYLINEFHINYVDSINYTYFLKFTPYFFFILSILLFIISFCEDFKKNITKEKNDITRLSFWELIGKSFYWLSGEKLESNSDETIMEIEPSNLRFRNFLNDIDTELIANEKTLILTIDNTDRLTSEKLKSIWSTINIFFAENNHSIFFKNIWLIIPFDPKKVIDSFKEEKNIGIGLLEKTFALTFKVPPPLISNWELFFKLCFNKSFDEIDIDENEIEILLRVYENYEKEITPRRIINFINQLATYYIQSPTIELRYFSIVILKKDLLFDGIINENIINRSMYLEKLDTFFTEDINLELNLAKVIYGVDNDIDAQESLLHNLIEERLKNLKVFDEEVLSLPYFYTYFDKYFKKFIDNSINEKTTNKIFFDKVTAILNQLEPILIKSYTMNIFYKNLWEYYLKKIDKHRFKHFNETIKGVCKNCNRNSKIELINNSLVSIIGDNSKEINGFPKENQILYINFLKEVDSFIAQNKNFSFKDLSFNEQEILAELIINLISEDKELYKKIKVKLSIENLKTFLIDEPFDNNLSTSKLIQYKNELSFLNQNENLNFIEKDINNNWINNSFNSLDEIDTLIFYHSIFNNINIDKISIITFSSIVDLILIADKNSDLTNAFLLIFINYNRAKTNNIANEFNKALERFDDITYLNMIKKINQYTTYENLYKVLDLCIQFDGNKNIKDFALNLFKVKSFKLNNESFNWILRKYTILNSRILNFNDFNLYDYLNKNAKNYEIEIENIDVELIIKSSKFLNTELIEKSNSYLLNNVGKNRAFLQNTTTKEYKLFVKLLDLDKIKKEFFNDNFIHSFGNLIINNETVQISNQQIIKIKSFIDDEKLNSILELNLNRIAVSKNAYILSPEIFSFFDRLQRPNKYRILQLILDNFDFYNEQFLKHIMETQNNNLIDVLRNNLLNCPNKQIKELAIKKGIIESN